MGRRLNVENTYFFDTYALFELICGNPAYEKFQNAKGAITVFNLMELCYSIRKKSTLAEAEKYVKKFAPLLIEVEPSDLLAATQLKFENRQLSKADAIGYVVSRRIGVKFLTGDKEFKHMKNAEYVH